MDKNLNTPDIEKALEKHFQSHQPSPAFLANLENQIIETHAGQQTLMTQLEESQSQTSKQEPRQQHHKRWYLAPAFISLALVLVVLIMGPRRVLAQVQSLLGYVPGYGFVHAEDLRALLEPVSQTKEGVTLTVKQAIVNDEATYIILSGDGLPSDEETLVIMKKIIEENQGNWQEVEPILWQTKTRLILPDGSVLAEGYYNGAPWEGYYTFPTLPKDVLELTFETDRVAGLPPGTAPENWRFNLKLGYLSESTDTAHLEELGEAGAQYQLALLTPVAVSASSQQDPFYQFSLRLLDAVYAETETALRLQLEGVPAGWESVYMSLDAQLSDAQGYIYPQIYGPTTGRTEEGLYILTYKPVSESASELTLSVNGVSFQIPISGQAVTVDFGSDTNYGDTIPVDSTIDVLGIPVHFSAVTIVRDTAHTSEQEPVTTLEFSIDPIHIVHGMIVEAIGFSPEVFQMLGSMSGGGGGGGGGGSTPDYANISIFISIPADLPIPKGSLDFPINSVIVRLMGPYMINWQVSGN